MATALSHTFVDHVASPAVIAAIRAAPRPRTSSDTLNDVIKDDARRNKLIDDNNLLKGVCMTPLGPAVSSLELIVRPSTLHAAVDQSASIHTTTVEAEYTEKLLQENYTSVSVKVSAPYVTASVDYSQETSWQNTATTKTVAVSSRYLFPQGRIDFAAPGSGFPGEVELSEDFTAAVDAALQKPTPTDQREALDAVFNKYGHVFRTEVQIGGTLSAHTSETYSRTENDTSVKEDVKTSLEVAVQDWGLGVTGGHGNLTTTVHTAENRVLDVQYVVQGGDYTKILDTDAWIASTDDSDFWRVVEVTEVIATADLLPEPKRSTVKRLMVPLLGEWVPVEELTLIEPVVLPHGVAVYQPKHSIPSGWFWLGHSIDGTHALIVKPTLPRKAGRNYAIALAEPGTNDSVLPLPTVPHYEFLAMYLPGFNWSPLLKENMASLRPGLFVEGDSKRIGGPLLMMIDIYETFPKQQEGEEGECLNLQTLIGVQIIPSDGPASSTTMREWAIRKDAILFDSGET